MVSFGASGGWRPLSWLVLLTLMTLCRSQALNYFATQGLACGTRANCILYNPSALSEDSVVCWGAGDHGRLGRDGTGKVGDATKPMGQVLRSIVFSDTIPATQVSMGVGTCALFANGRIRCWGWNEEGQAGIGEFGWVGNNNGEMSTLPYINFPTSHLATKIKAGYRHHCAIFNNGGLRCWGAGGNGKLGTDDTNNRGTASRPTDTLPFIAFKTTHEVVDIDLGEQFTCALFNNGLIRCWGKNDKGQLGQDNTNNLGNNANEMTALDFLQFSDTILATQVTCGNTYACALFANQKVRCWGNGEHGRLGLNDGDTGNKGNNPGEMTNLVYLPLSDLIVELQSPGKVMCARTVSSRVRCWGKGNEEAGILGLMAGGGINIGNNAGEIAALTDIPFSTASPVMKLCDASAMGQHHCAIFADNSIRCWGSGADGKLGTDSSNNEGNQAGEISSIGPVRLPLCGDGIRHPFLEECDDGNSFDSDGCDVFCKIEPTYICSTGSPSICVMTCGNGLVEAPETCDDGNAADGDGCEACQIISPWQCSNVPSVCRRVPSTMPMEPIPEVYVREGQAVTFEVVLDIKPIADVSLTFSVVPGTPIFGPPSMLFKVGNWNVSQTFSLVVPATTVTGKSIEMSFFSIQAFFPAQPDAYSGVLIPTIAVHVLDADLEVLQHGVMPTVEEGFTAATAIKLDTPIDGPPNQLTIVFDKWATHPRLSFNPPNVTITNVNWNLPHSVAISVSRDGVTGPVNTTSEYPMTVVEGDLAWIGLNFSLPIVIIETDHLILTSASALTVTEGSQQVFTVTLSEAPYPAGTFRNVTVSWTGTAGTVDVSPSELMFTSIDYNQPQTVTVTATDNTVVESSVVTGGVSLTQGFGFTIFQYISTTIGVTVRDNDFFVSATPCCAEQVLLDGGTLKISVAISAAPQADVTVTPSLTGTFAGAEHLTLSPGGPIVFTPTSPLVQTFVVTDSTLPVPAHTPITGRAISFAVVSSDPRLPNPAVGQTPLRIINNANEGALIDTVEPMNGQAVGGEEVTITGQRLGASAGDITVTIAGVAATVLSHTPLLTTPPTTRVIVRLGATPGEQSRTGSVSVTTTAYGIPLTVQARGVFEYFGIDPPSASASPSPASGGASPGIAITNVDPSSGAVGDALIVTLTSPGFNSPQTVSLVREIMVATSLNCSEGVAHVPPSSLTCILVIAESTPVGTSGGVRVSLRNGTEISTPANMTAFSVTAPTAIGGGGATNVSSVLVRAFVPASLSPDGGETVTIIGTGFGSFLRDVVSVTVAGQPCAPIMQVQQGRVVCESSSGAPGSSGPVTVTRRSGARGISASLARYAIPGPLVVDVKPLKVKAEGGTELTIKGSGFVIPGSTSNTGANATKIFVGGTECTHPDGIFLAPDLLRCLCPAATRVTNPDVPVPIVVEVSGLRSAGTSVTFEYGIECDPPCGWEGRCVNDQSQSFCECEKGWYLPPACETKHIVLRPPVLFQVSELGGQSVFSLVLSHEPAGDVTIGMTSSHPTEASVQPSEVVFTQTSWSSERQIIVTGQADAVHDGDQRFMISFSVSSVDPDFVNAGDRLTPFSFVNLDAPPEIMTAVPETCPLLGCNVTLTGRNLATFVGVFLDNQGAELSQIQAPSLMSALQSSRSLLSLHVAQQELHQWETQQMVVESPATTGGYHSLTVVNPSGTISEARIFFTDDCPDEGMYGRGRDCQPCPEGGICPGGYRIIAKPGYWNSGEESGFIARCDPPERCLGQPTSGGDVECAPLYTGKLCAECIPDHYQDVNGECQACPPAKDTLPFLIADVLLWSLVAIAHLCITDDMSLSYLVMAVRTLQMVAGLGEMGDADLPDFVKEVYKVLHLFSGDYDFLKPDCFNPTPYHTKFWYKLLYSIGIFVPTWLLTLSAAVIVQLYRQSKGTTDVEVDEDHLRAGPWYWDRFRRSFVIWLSVIYFTTTATTIDTLSCWRIEKQYVMITQPSVRCYNVPGQLEVTIVSALLILLLTVGFPGGFALFLRKNRDRMLDHRFLNKYSVLYEFYRPDFTTFWTIEFAIVTIVAASNSALVPHPKIQFSICTVIFASKFIFVAWKKPFLDWFTNALHMIMSIAYLIGLNISLLSKVVNVDLDKVNGPVGIVMIVVITLAIIGMIVAMVMRLMFGTTEDDTWAAQDLPHLAKKGESFDSDLEMDSVQYDSNGKLLLWGAHDNNQDFLADLASSVSSEDESPGFSLSMASILPWSWFGDEDPDTGDADDNEGNLSVDGAITSDEVEAGIPTADRPPLQSLASASSLPDLQPDVTADVLPEREVALDIDEDVVPDIPSVPVVPDELDVDLGEEMAED